MNKVNVQNLAMIVTNRCNLNCSHCLRGCKNNKDMGKKVIKSTLKQIKKIGNLHLSGGEPTLALDVIENIFDYIITYEIEVENVSTIINGTIFNMEFLRLLNYINEYITYLREDNSTTFLISNDVYHQKELERLKLYDEYLENVDQYIQSFYYYGMKELNNSILREGNAVNLNDNLTKPLIPNKMVMYNHNKELCMGPVIAVNPDGVVTEVDASIENQETIYNYGNVLNETLKDIVKKRIK